MGQTPIRKWSRVILEPSTRAHKCSMSRLGLRHGGQISTMKIKMSVAKLFAGVATLPNQKPPVAVPSSTTTMCSTFTQSPAKHCFTSPTGTLDCALLMSPTLQQYQTQKASHGHKTTKSADGLDAPVRTTAGTALMVAATPTCLPKNGVAAAVRSTATAGFTTRFPTITSCATEPKTPTQWKLGTLSAAQDLMMLNSASTGAT